MEKPLQKALSCVANASLQSEIRTFDGCWVPRKIRGDDTRWSEHAYGRAIDINAQWNMPGKPSTQHPDVVACFERAGFRWGGHWDHIDAMHFEI